MFFFWPGLVSGLDFRPRERKQIFIWRAAAANTSACHAKIYWSFIICSGISYTHESISHSIWNETNERQQNENDREEEKLCLHKIFMQYLGFVYFTWGYMNWFVYTPARFNCLIKRKKSPLPAHLPSLWVLVVSYSQFRYTNSPHSDSGFFSRCLHAVGASGYEGLFLFFPVSVI